MYAAGESARNKKKECPKLLVLYHTAINVHGLGMQSEHSQYDVSASPPNCEKSWWWHHTAGKENTFLAAATNTDPKNCHIRVGRLAMSTLPLTTSGYCHNYEQSILKELGVCSAMFLRPHSQTPFLSIPETYSVQTPKATGLVSWSQICLLNYIAVSAKLKTNSAASCTFCSWVLAPYSKYSPPVGMAFEPFWCWANRGVQKKAADLEGFLG